MKITVVGTGYVGLVTGTCFSEMGFEVVCVDVESDKIEGLKRGIVPIYEPGLEKMVTDNYQARRLRFTTDLVPELDGTDIVFIAVGTPPNEDGSADLQYVLDVARTIGKNINKYSLIVTKSTVPVGTMQKVKIAIQEELDKRGAKVEFDIASNPEFLKEGDAINDFMKPDRIVVGVESDRAKELMEKLYKPFMMSNYRLIFTDIPSAEMIKYTANAMLATRISFMNDIANLCEIVGADVDMVRKGIGSDTRIGNKFLYPGCGYGGSCFPKDVKALIKTAEQKGYDMKVLKAVEEVNDIQKSILFDKFKKHFNGELSDKTVAMWGLSFKPETDDMREAPALKLIEKLTQAGVSIKAYDPIAMPEARRRLKTYDNITYCSNKYEAVRKVDALMLVTEWKEFRIADWDHIKQQISSPVIIDGRNIYDKKELEAKGFIYYRIG